jgi:hypothetical protein
MFFMPYYPLQILLSGALPGNFLSAVLGPHCRAAPEDSGGGPINYSDADWGDLVPAPGLWRAAPTALLCGHSRSIVGAAGSEAAGIALAV